MMNDNESGHHRNGYGWQFRWTDGTLYCHKNSQGGGTGAIVWDSSNATRASNSNLMYYQGFTLDANTMESNATGFTYSVNAPYTGPVVRFSTGGGYDLWLNSPYNGNGYGLAFRTRNGDTGSLNSWQYPAVYGVNVNGGGALYSTIYYDQNNTDYYCDPNSTSNFIGLTVANRITGSVTGCTFSSDAVNVANITNRIDSGFYEHDTPTTAEGWPYDGGWAHLIACTHTNDANYYSMQFAASFFSNDLYYRSTNGNGGSGWSKVALYSGSDLYAEIFRDSNDPTNVYADFSSTSDTAVRINGGLWVSRGNVPGVGIVLADDGDIVDLNDTYCSMRFTGGVRIFSTNRGGSAAITLGSNGNVTANAYYGNGSNLTNVTAANISNTGTVTLASATESNSIYITQPSYTTDQPVKLLNFDWYGNVWSLGNIRSGSTPSNGFGVYSSGTERARFTTSGLSAASFTSTSDIKLKTNIQPIQSSLAKLFELNGVTFEWKESKEPSIGVIAQDVEKVFPELVQEVSDHKTVNYNGLVAVLIEALKEQQEQIDELKKAIKTHK
jgi:hypothetical protein